MPGAHAKLSPSGSSRWLNCPGSVRMTANLENKSGDAAFRGTVIHQAGENILLGEECHAGISITIEGESKAEWLAKDMFEEADFYAKYVMDLASRCPNSEMIAEMKVDLTDIADETFGHSDAVVIENGNLHIIDLKTGAGLVSAKDNSQLMLYGHGAFKELEMFHDIENIVFHIVQNNSKTGSDKSNSHTIIIDELIDWIDEIVKPAAKMALTEDAICVPGDSQCQWCQAASFCPALMDQVEDMFDELTENHQNENIKHIGEVVPLEKALNFYKSVSLITTWMKAIENRIFDKLELGEDIPGYKLVKKIKHKKWTDESEAYEKLKSWEKLDDIAPRKLVTPNQAEKILGKMTAPKTKKFNDLWIRPQGELTIALESDKRPAEKPVIEEFDIIDDDNDDL